MGFTKLFSSITESSIWVESDKTLRVWVAFLARANWHGIVEGSIPGMASLCRMSIEDFSESLKILESPDKFSRNPDHDGKRIEVIPGGWKILNYENYREKNQEQAGSRAEYMRKYREENKNVTRNKCNVENVTRNTDIDNRLQITDKYKEKKENKEKKNLSQGIGEFKNIILMDEEKEKLFEKYGQEATNKKIESFSCSLKSQPQKYSKYKSHYATLNNWLRNDAPAKKEEKKLAKDIFVKCPKCGKETTREDLRKFESCPACYKPASKEKIRELIGGLK